MVTIKEIEFAIGEYVNVNNKEMKYLIGYVKRLLELYSGEKVYPDRLKPCSKCLLEGIQVEPEIKSKKECYGHGCYVDEYYIQCPNCGMRFEECSNYEGNGLSEAINKWNREN